MSLETVDDVVEWLADEAAVYGIADGLSDGSGHADDCVCRLCWTIGVRRRICAAVMLEVKLKSDEALRADIEWSQHK